MASNIYDQTLDSYTDPLASKDIPLTGGSGSNVNTVEPTEKTGGNTHLSQGLTPKEKMNLIRERSLQVDKLLSTPEYAPYTASDFDNVAYANRILSHGEASDTKDTAEERNVEATNVQELSTAIAKINIGIDTLTKHINEEVILRYDDLVDQIPKLNTLDENVRAIKPKIDLLSESYNRISSQFFPRYNRLANDVELLSRVHEASIIMACVARYYHQQRKLEEISLVVKQHPTTDSEPGQNSSHAAIENETSSGIVDILDNFAPSSARSLATTLRRDIQNIAADNIISEIDLPDVHS